MIVGLDAAPGLVGTTIKGVPFTVSAQEKTTFEDVTHVTEAYPEDDAPEFGTDVVEGFHTLALLDAACTLAHRFDPATTYAFNYGLDRVRFTAPVHVGDTVETTIEVVDVTPRGAGYLVTRRCTQRVAGQDRPAVVADWKVLVLPRTE